MKKIKSSQLHRAIFLVVALLFITQISIVYAFEFDNVKSYDENTKTITIKNSFLGLPLDKVAEIELKTPLNYKVPRGYQKVAEFEIRNFEDYTNALKELKLYDLKDGNKEFLRNFDYKYKTYVDVSVNDYKNIIIGTSENGTIIYERQLIGSHLELREKWINIISSDFIKDDIMTIGIFTEVKEGDIVEWIPTFYGKEIIEWATWTESLNVGLVSYYKLNETSGVVLDSLVINNGTNNGATRGVDGIINNSFSFDGINDFVNISDSASLDFGTGAFSISLWINDSSWGNGHWIISKDDGINNGFYIRELISAGNKLNFFVGDGTDFANSVTSALGSIADGNWHHVVAVFPAGGSGTATVYVDNVSEGTDAYTAVGSTDSSSDLFFSTRSASTGFASARLDEIGIWNRTLSSDEVTQLYNNGTGITWTDFFAPVVTLNSPVDTFNTTNQTINFNGTVTSPFGIINVSFILDGVYNETNTSGVNDTDYLFTKIISDGSHNWTYESCNVVGCRNATVRTFTIDTIFPQITIEIPIGILDFGKIGFNETLNVTFIDTNLDTCWFDYNGTNITIDGCLTGVKNSTNFILEEGNLNMTIYANDSFGNENNNFTSWDYKVLEINQTYNNETTEGSLETFLALIKLGSGLSITDTILIYNSSSNAGQSFASGQNTILRKIDFTIPNVETDTNITFYWSITLSDSTNINLSSQNQTIFNLNLDNCSSFTNELYNFTVVDEEEQTILPNATIEIAINIYDETRTILVLNHSDIYEAINPLRICLNKNISSSTYSVDVIVRYEDTGYANEYYNIVNSTLTNTTSSQIITLYDLNSTDSTEFQLTFTGADFLPIENALVHVDRQYISENTFKTVELPKTDYNGQAVLHLVRNDVIYNIRITKGGAVLGNFENLVAFCDDFTIGDCNINLNAFDSVESIFNYDSSVGIIYSNPTYNTTTNKVNFIFVTSDGSSKTVVLEVLRNDIFGNRSVCNASLVSSGGTLNCDVNPNIDNSTLKINVYVDSILEVKSSVKIDTTNYGVAGYLIMFIMAISFILMFSGSKTGVLVAIGLTLASSIGMGLVSGSLIGVGASGLWLLVIIFIGIYKLNSERPA